MLKSMVFGFPQSIETVRKYVECTAPLRNSKKMLKIITKMKFWKNGSWSCGLFDSMRGNEGGYAQD